MKINNNNNYCIKKGSMHLISFDDGLFLNININIIIPYFLSLHFFHSICLKNLVSSFQKLIISPFFQEFIHNLKYDSN
jgi:hypothetical protein